jgi:single-strand DNA-binding protein
MAQSVNKAFLIGRLGKDPVERDNGNIATFSMAMTDSWNDKTSGERRENTTWINVVVFNKALAEITIRYLTKGSLVAVEGAIENREFTDTQGAKRTVTEIVIRNFKGDITMLGDPPARPEGQTQRRAAPGAEPAGRR